MKFSFKEILYKNGINLCVDVPQRVTAKMVATKGYIPVKGTINKHPFTQTLVPVKNAPYRLFVNGAMLKGSGAKQNTIATFIIRQDDAPPVVSMPAELKKALMKHRLLNEFNKFSASRQKEVFRYLANLKAKESLLRNIDKVIEQLTKKQNEDRGFLRSLHLLPKKSSRPGK